MSDHSSNDSVLLDAIEDISVSRNAYPNELRTLRTLSVGLSHLAADIRKREIAVKAMLSPDTTIYVMLGGVGSAEDVAIVDCYFHWFATSACNYARLVGLVAALSRGEVAKGDSPEKISRAVNGYVGRVQELQAVRIWRNKIAGHFAATDPREHDNPATLAMSVMPPVGIRDGRYGTSTMTLTTRRDGISHTSEIPAWELSETFEAMSARYWLGQS